MELDLSFNHTGDAGVKTLSQILKNPNCALQKFKFVSGHTTQLLCSVLKHLNIKDELKVFFSTDWRAVVLQKRAVDL